MIPTPKRRILTKTTSNTVGDTPAATNTTTPVQDNVQNATAAPTDAKVTPTDATTANKTPKQAPGELPPPSDEYVLPFQLTHCGLTLSVAKVHFVCH